MTEYHETILERLLVIFEHESSSEYLLRDYFLDVHEARCNLRPHQDLHRYWSDIRLNIGKDFISINSLDTLTETLFDFESLRKERDADIAKIVQQETDFTQTPDEEIEKKLSASYLAELEHYAAETHRSANLLYIANNRRKRLAEWEPKHSGSITLKQEVLSCIENIIFKNISLSDPPQKESMVIYRQKELQQFADRKESIMYAYEEKYTYAKERIIAIQQLVKDLETA